jgi:disulfide bond formation protein DsbB
VTASSVSTARNGRRDLTRLALFAIVAFGAGALSVAWIGEHAFGIAPCILCLYQRVPYGVVAVVAAAAALLPLSAKHRRGALALCSAVFLAGSLLAFYSVGVEEHWWAGVPGCRVPSVPETVSAEELLASLSQRGGLRACDEGVWRLLGVSLAGYNVVVQGLAALAGVLALKWLKSPGQGR